MTGFNNPLVGGGGALVYPAIHSPNFNQAAGTGWSIAKDGTAFFSMLSLLNSLSVGATIIVESGTTPWGPLNSTDPAIVFKNASGAIILVVDPAKGGVFAYQDNGSAVQGVLIGAQVSKNTTDPVNNTAVSAGVNLIDPAFGDSITIVGANITLIQAPFTKNTLDTANTGSTNQGPFRHVAAPEQGHAGHAVQRWYGTSPDNTRAAGTVISLTDPPTRATPELLEIQGTLALANASAPGSLSGYAKPFANGGVLDVVDGNDGNTYDTEILRLFVAVDVPIPSTSATTLMSKAVAANTTYRVDGIVKGVQGATAAGQIVRFSGPTVSFNMIAIESNAVGNTSVTDSDLTGAFPNDHTTPAWTAGTTFYIRFRGIFTTTAAGTFAVQGREGTSGDPWTAKAGSLMDFGPALAS